MNLSVATDFDLRSEKVPAIFRQAAYTVRTLTAGSRAALRDRQRHSTNPNVETRI
jgi:hypothetical protein